MKNETMIERLNNAIFEANRFIAKAHEAKDVLCKAKYGYQFKEVAAAKRSSMDLTRSLVGIRQTY